LGNLAPDVGTEIPVHTNRRNSLLDSISGKSASWVSHTLHGGRSKAQRHCPDLKSTILCLFGLFV
jgi:hypothetical protein